MMQKLIIAAATLFVVACGAEQSSHAAEPTPAAAFRICSACHIALPPDNPASKARMIGPNLYGVYGAPAAQVEGFAYSKALRSSEVVWDEAALDAFIENPSAYIRGNRMSFFGEKNPQKRALIIEYLKAQSGQAASE